jgi:hypothetical protein
MQIFAFRKGTLNNELQYIRLRSKIAGIKGKIFPFWEKKVAQAIGLCICRYTFIPQTEFWLLSGQRLESIIRVILLNLEQLLIKKIHQVFPCNNIPL